MEKFYTARNFLIGGCVGVTIVNIGKIIVNYVQNTFVAETERIIPLLIALFFLFGITFAICSYVIKTYLENKTIEERIEKLQIQRLISITLLIISIMFLLVTLKYGDNAYIIASCMLIVIFIFTDIATLLTIRFLKKVVEENKED